MKIFISTSDGYDFLMRPFMHLFNKFWGEQSVTILGYREPPFSLLENFNFISLADKQETPNQWASDHNRFFSSIDDSHFIWSLEDTFLLRPVNFKIYNSLLRHLDDENIGRISLCNPIKNTQHKEIEILEAHSEIELEQDSHDRISVVWSLWKRDYILKYLRDGWSPWDTEIRGSQLAKNDGWRIIGSKSNHVVDYASAHRISGRGLPGGELDFRYTNRRHLMLDPESLKELISLGMINDRLQLIKK